MFSSLKRLQATTGYSQLLKSLRGDMKQAMIARNTLEKNTIKSIMAAIKNREINGAQQTETALKKTLDKLVNQRNSSAALFEKEGREDLAEVEKKEAEVIQKYADAIFSEQK